MISPIIRRIVVLAVLAMVATACGQKPGVHETRFSGGPSTAGSDAALTDGDFDDDALAGDVDDEVGDDVGNAPVEGPQNGGSAAQPVGGAPADSGGSTTGATDGGETQTRDDPAPADRESPPTSEPEQASGGDRTGVTDTTIRIGVHAPITGAAPLPQKSVEAARTQYWDAIGEVHGREVEVLLRDDQYNPSRATRVCNELIQRQEVFILGGIGGVDQINACARTAAQQGVPYFSSGTVEGVLRQLPRYFATSMSYKQQAALIVQLMQTRARPDNNRIGILRDRTPNFNEVVEEVRRLGEQAGFEVLMRQHQNGPSDAQWLVQSNIQTAFPIMAPSSFVQVVNAPGGSIRHWVGAGPTMGLNTVANASCPAISGAMFLSAWSGLNQADRLDPRFNRDAGGGDDIQWAAWTGNTVVHEILDGVGRDLTREAFVRHARTQVIETGVAPELRHTPDNPFGVSQTHLLEVDCSRRQFVTPDDGLFATSFS